MLARLKKHSSRELEGHRRSSESGEGEGEGEGVIWASAVDDAFSQDLNLVSADNPEEDWSPLSRLDSEVVEMMRAVSTLVGELELVREEALHDESGDEYEGETLGITVEEAS